LGAVVADDSAEVDGLRPGPLDALTDCLVARGLRVPRLEAEDLDAQLFRPELETVGDTFPEGLVVVKDVDVRDRGELLALGQFEGLAQEQISGRRPLEVVTGRYPNVVPLAARVVDARLPGRRPRCRVSQLHG